MWAVVASVSIHLLISGLPIGWTPDRRRGLGLRRRIPWSRPHPIIITITTTNPEEVFGVGSGFEDPVLTRTRLWRLRFLSCWHLQRSPQNLEPRGPGLISLSFLLLSTLTLTHGPGTDLEFYYFVTDTNKAAFFEEWF